VPASSSSTPAGRAPARAGDPHEDRRRALVRARAAAPARPGAGTGGSDRTRWLRSGRTWTSSPRAGGKLHEAAGELRRGRKRRLRPGRVRARAGAVGRGSSGQAEHGRAPLGRAVSSTRPAASSTRPDAGELHEAGRGRAPPGRPGAGAGSAGPGGWVAAAAPARVWRAPAMEVEVGAVVVGWLGKKMRFF
jgi:hypothetical protein